MNKNDTVCLQDICRVCLEKSSKMYPLVGPVVNVDVNISTMITFCTSIELALDEDLPKAVCIPCFRTIRIAYNFICQFKEANQKLVEEVELNRIKHRNNSEQDNVIKKLSNNESVSLQDFNQEDDEEEKIIITCVNEPLDNEIDIDLSNSLKLEANLKSEEITIPTKTIYYRSLNKKIIKQYECPLCSKGFRAFDSGFVKHLLTCHKDTVLNCNKCSSEMLFNMEAYVQHYKKIHLYQCHICSKSFGRKSSQYYHMKLHNEDKSYECSYENCKKTFLTSWSLRKHLNTHSDATKYICSKCGSKFNTYDTFRYHQKTHDGKRNHLCTECGRAFLQAVHLKYHMWKHTGIKQFHCAYCDKSYTSVTQLKKHKRKYCEAEKTE